MGETNQISTHSCVNQQINLTQGFIMKRVYHSLSYSIAVIFLIVQLFLQELVFLLQVLAISSETFSNKVAVPLWVNSTPLVKFARLSPRLLTARACGTKTSSISWTSLPFVAFSLESSVSRTFLKSLSFEFVISLEIKGGRSLQV